MKIFQRGASTLDLLIAFGFSIALCLFLLPPMYLSLDRVVKAQSLRNSVAQVTQASNIWYGKELMRTRCLTLQHPLTINALINDALVDRQLQTLDWTFSVKTIDSTGAFPRQRPTRIVITVTIPDESLRIAMQQALSPLAATNSALIFDVSIQADIVNTLAIMDRSTGCIQ